MAYLTRATRPSANPDHIAAVKVEMDFLNPFMDSCKKTANDIWVQLPPPVQAGMPFFAVGAASGILVYSIQERRLAHQARSSGLAHTNRSSDHVHGIQGWWTLFWQASWTCLNMDDRRTA